MSEVPLLSVAVITHDRKESLFRLLDSALRQGHPPSRTEIVILDDGSSDGTSEAVQSWFKSLRGYRRLFLDRNESAKNVAAARRQNLASVSPDAEWVLSCDDDAVLEGGALGRLLEAGAEPRAGVVGPKIVFLSHPDRTFQCANYVGRWTGRYWGEDAGERRECDWVSTTLCLMRGEALRKAGGFNADYFASHEEVEFCLKAQAAGFKILYEPAALAYHDVELDFFRPRRLYYLYRNKYIVIRDCFAGPRRWTALAFHSSFGLGRALALLLARRLAGRLDPSETVGAVLSAFRDGLLDRRGPEPV